MADRDYYILDARSCVGNCALWWGPNNSGYVCNLDEAGLYTLEDALSHRPTDVPVHRDVARGCVVSHVRWDHLRMAGVTFSSNATEPPPVLVPGKNTQEERHP